MDAVATDTVVAGTADTDVADTHTDVAAMPAERVAMRAERVDMPVERAQPTVAELEVQLLQVVADLPVARLAADSAAAADSMAAAAVATPAVVVDTGKFGALRTVPQIASELSHRARLLRQAGSVFVLEIPLPASICLAVSASATLVYPHPQEISPHFAVYFSSEEHNQERSNNRSQNSSAGRRKESSRRKKHAISRFFSHVT
jgi:hypothetical protein